MGECAEIEKLRNQYTATELSEKTVSADPIDQFGRWYSEAGEAKIAEPSAMILATASKYGIPTVRTVLLKGFDGRGFVFYSNYESRKGRDLSENPKAALLFLWKEIERQIRVSGTVTKVSQEESEHYFRSRPNESKVAAWASKQSSMIPNREHLMSNYEKYKDLYEGKEIPLPPFWADTG